jgi:hypothetical protein
MYLISLYNFKAPGCYIATNNHLPALADSKRGAISGLRKPNLRKRAPSNSHMLRKDADNTARLDPVMIEIVRCDALDRVAQKQKLRLAFDG